MPLKEKIDCWADKVSKINYSFLRFLNEFLAVDSKAEDTDETKDVVVEHLKLLKKTFNRYYPEDESETCLLKWIVRRLISVRSNK